MATRIGNWFLGTNAALVFGFLYLPVLLLPLFSFNDSSVVAFPLQGFTARWYQNLADIPTLHEAVRCCIGSVGL